MRKKSVYAILTKKWKKSSGALWMALWGWLLFHLARNPSWSGNKRRTKRELWSERTGLHGWSSFCSHSLHKSCFLFGMKKIVKWNTTASALTEFQRKCLFIEVIKECNEDDSKCAASHVAPAHERLPQDGTEMVIKNLFPSAKVSDFTTLNVSWPKWNWMFYGTHIARSLQQRGVERKGDGGHWCWCRIATDSNSCAKITENRQLCAVEWSEAACFFFSMFRFPFTTPLQVLCVARIFLDPSKGCKNCKDSHLLRWMVRYVARVMQDGTEMFCLRFDSLCRLRICEQLSI